MLLTIYSFLSPLHIANLVIGQNLGQDLCFREKFDVAVARAVAEMRILGNLENPLSQLFSVSLRLPSVLFLLKSFLLVLHFQLNIVFHWYALVVYL